MSNKRVERKDEANSRAQFAVTMRLLRLHRAAEQEQHKSYAGWSVDDFSPDLSVSPDQMREEERPWVP